MHIENLVERGMWYIGGRFPRRPGDGQFPRQPTRGDCRRNGNHDESPGPPLSVATMGSVPGYPERHSGELPRATATRRV